MRATLHISMTVEYEAEYELIDDQNGKDISLPAFKDQLRTLILEEPDLILEQKGASIFCTVTNA